MSPTQHEEMRTERTISKIKNKNCLGNVDIFIFRDVSYAIILLLLCVLEVNNIFKCVAI